MLYSVILKFKSNENIYFKYYPGESIHGMLFNLLSQKRKEEAKYLHKEHKNKPFTISPIMPYPSWEKGKRMIKAEKEYFLRFTFLEDKWYLFFMEYFLYLGSRLILQDKEIEINGVLTHSDKDKRCNSIEYKDLIKNAGYNKNIIFKFHSTVSFRLGEQHIIFPEPKLLFTSLLGKWNKFSLNKLSLTEEDFKYVYISKYDLNSTMEIFNDYFVKGFRGTCEYEIDIKLSKVKTKELNILADFAFYSGVGYKTTMGLGQVARN